MPARRLTPERMDDPSIDPQDHALALKGLARINRWTGSADILWPTIRDEARAVNRPLKILDIATGSGDIPIAFARKARKHGISIEVSGCDISETAIATSTTNAQLAGIPATFFQHDVIHRPLPAGYDVITTSLFLHHLKENEVIHVLQAMSVAANRIVIVSDLSRSRLNRALVWIGCRLFSRSPVVHFDGPVSVDAAFQVDEARQLAKQAGLEGAIVQSRFPCRWLMTWRKSA